MTARANPAVRPVLIAIAIAAVAGAMLGLVAVWTRPTRQAVATYTELIGAANRQDANAARLLCSARYLKTHELAMAEEGGIVGLPRNIHPNFQVWKNGPSIWLCPTNRVGPVYQFVQEQGSWRFDGPIGILRAGGELLRYTDTP